MYNRKMDKMSEKKRFSIVARAKSFTHAFRGIKLLFKTQHNFWVQIFFSILVVGMGIFFHISEIEWIFIILSIGLVIIAETFNTAFEFDIDLTSPTYHPYARDTKDVAAGAVLVTTLMSIIVGLIIFLPKIIGLF
jgi:diacylglycerol kinase (ATP)